MYRPWPSRRGKPGGPLDRQGHGGALAFEFIPARVEAAALMGEVRLLPTDGAEADDLLARSEARQEKPPQDATPAQRCAWRASGLRPLTTQEAATPSQSPAA